jgi:hypothetical protein
VSTGEAGKSMVAPWWKSPLVRIATRTFLYAYLALFVVGFLATFAKRFDDARIEEAIVDGLALSEVAGTVYLVFQCKGQVTGYVYDIQSDTLKVETASHASLLLQNQHSLLGMLPVTKEQVALAVGLVGGSVGMASHFDRVRIAATEREVARCRIGFVHQPSRSEKKAMAVLLAPLAVAGTAVVATVSGYYAGAWSAKSLGIDVDCASKAMHRKLSAPSTWRLLLGTVFTRGYASLHNCIQKRQLRTIASYVVIDYADAPASEEVGSQLSLHDDTLIRALRADPNRQCGQLRKGMTIEGDDGKKTQIVYSGRDLRYPGCWRKDDVDRALATRRVALAPPLTADVALSDYLVSREFPTSSKHQSTTRPTAADALVKAMERLGKGKLINEKGETTIGIEDIRLLLSARTTCSAATASSQIR